MTNSNMKNYTQTNIKEILADGTKFAGLVGIECRLRGIRGKMDRTESEAISEFIVRGFLQDGEYFLRFMGACAAEKHRAKPTMDDYLSFLQAGVESGLSAKVKGGYAYVYEGPLLVLHDVKLGNLRYRFSQDLFADFIEGKHVF